MVVFFSYDLLKPLYLIKTCDLSHGTVTLVQWIKLRANAFPIFRRKKTYRFNLRLFKSLNNFIKFLPYTKSIELYNDSEKNDCLAILKKIISNTVARGLRCQVQYIQFL